MTEISMIPRFVEHYSNQDGARKKVREDRESCLGHFKANLAISVFFLEFLVAKAK